jgi:hypothetical protein
MELDMSAMLSIFLGIALGVSLSAAAGFRVFVPFLIMSVAALSGHLSLGESWSWIGTYPALLVFAIASVVEILAYYVPLLDNVLDTITTPAAVIAGVLLTAASITELSPLLTWTLAIIAGGGTAALVQTGTVIVRGISTTTTLGLGNFIVSTGELVGSVVASVLALVLPLLALILVILFLIWMMRLILRVDRRLPL